VFPLDSAHSTSIQNVYHTADRERRTCTAISRIDPYRVEEIPDVDAPIYHIAGLMRGDLGNEIIEFASKKAMAAGMCSVCSVATRTAPWYSTIGPKSGKCFL
jgi:hypothetical protein